MTACPECGESDTLVTTERGSECVNPRCVRNTLADADLLFDTCVHCGRGGANGTLYCPRCARRYA